MWTILIRQIVQSSKPLTTMTRTVMILILLNNVNVILSRTIRIPSVDPDPGEVLYLTPLIEENKIEEARQASLVSFPDFQNIESYSAYFTVDKIHNSNLFFWFFPSESNYEEDPVILWLQGGPGSTSLTGLFHEIGPFSLTSNTTVVFRDFYWSQTHSVLFIDNPAGTGYSFTDDGYAQNQTKVGQDLYNALLQFFTLFPELQKNDFYIAGESYAGKYIPAIGYTILRNNPTAELKINLQGLSIGNGLCDPVNQLVYSDYLYQIGLIDSEHQQIWKQYEDKGINYMNNGQFDKAFDIFHDLIYRGNVNPTDSLLQNDTGFDYYYNYLHPDNPSQELNFMVNYVQRPEVRKALHVGNTTFGDDNVETNLLNDITRSVAPWISELLNNYPILFYSGQLDLIVPYPSTVNFLQKLNFTGSEGYKTAKRNKWYVGKDLAGYSKEVGYLTEVLVRFAGHMAPTDQPVWLMDMITRFTHKQSFTHYV